ncbi:MAG TPA: ribosome biogenesis factor YjgA [Steroidobacteraceae bacterium]
MTLQSSAAPDNRTDMPPIEPPDDEQDPAARPSRSARKRAAEQLQRLGVRLLTLKDAQLQALELPEALLEAIIEGRRLRPGPAVARHYQYIGKLMRGIDTAPLEQALDHPAGDWQPRAKMPK